MSIQDSNDFVEARKDERAKAAEKYFNRVAEARLKRLNALVIEQKQGTKGAYKIYQSSIDRLLAWFQEYDLSTMLDSEKQQYVFVVEE